MEYLHRSLGAVRQARIVQRTSFSQSDMYLYAGYELIGCIRKSPAPILNGVIYIVKEVKEKSEACPEGSVTVCMHEELSLVKHDLHMKIALDGSI